MKRHTPFPKNCLGFKTWLEAQSANDLQTMSVFRYGNYCGPGPKLYKPACNLLANGSPLPEPVDQVDALCQAHDMEYCRSGADWKAALPFGGNPTPGSRQADINLINRLKEIEPSVGGKAKLASNIIRKYFSTLEKYRQARDAQVESFLHEAAQDEPYAFRAVFTAGGPGSGKSFIATQMFKGLGFKFADSDQTLALLSRSKPVSLNAPEDSPDYEEYLGLMNKAMEKNKDRASLWRNQGLPLVIDITGRQAGLVQSLASQLQDEGYDTSMVYVLTPLDVARRRNRERGRAPGGRSVPDSFLVSANEEAQKNIPLYQRLFGFRFALINNDRDYSAREMKERIIPSLHRLALSLVGKPYQCQNPIGMAKIRGFQAAQKQRPNPGQSPPFEKRPFSDTIMKTNPMAVSKPGVA